MVLSMAFGAVAAAFAGGGKAVFDYNRENFMEDREMRMKKEFAERRYRIVQAALWREDVRAFVSLTERKMTIYLLVNVLLLGFNVNLWCEGRLPEGTPDWLLMGNQIAIGGSFAFLLLTVWMAMHAAVSAQAYQARVLTQLVRLPVPTWDELEACRTYASDFERVESKQMWRVPFLTGPQERHVPGHVNEDGTEAALEAPGTPVGSQSASGSTPGHNPQIAVATDPWGLERRGDDTYELGSHYGADVAKLRHMKIIRQAAVYWQTYDCFARVSMSIGVNQLLLALGYYLLGYVLVQVHAPLHAFAGVLCLVCTSEVIARIDLTLPPANMRLIQVLLAFGPAMSCFAAYEWAIETDLASYIAHCLAPIAFWSHGAVVGLLTLFLRVQEQENGAMLPLAFQGVLFLDVFGWMKEAGIKHTPTASPASRGVNNSSNSAEQGSLQIPYDSSSDSDRMSNAPSSLAPAQAAQQVVSIQSGIAAQSETVDPHMAPTAKQTARRRKEDEAGYYALDYLESNDALMWDGDESVDDKSDFTSKAPTRPALANIAYDAQSRPIPKRPAEKPQGTDEDLRYVVGAPRMWDTVSAVTPPSKEFFDAVSFMPPESRTRRTVEAALFTEENKEDEVEALRGTPSSNTLGPMQMLRSMRRQIIDNTTLERERSIETGHDNEMPGIVPWRIFRAAAGLLSAIWLFAGIFQLFEATNMWTLHIPFAWEEPSPGGFTGQMLLHKGRAGAFPSSFALNKAEKVDEGSVNHTSLLEIWGRSVSGSPPSLLGSEAVQVSWPYRTITPKGISCDRSGKVFVVTDGLSAFTANLKSNTPTGLNLLEANSSLSDASGKPHLARHPGFRRKRAKTGSATKLEFRRLAGCQVRSQLLQDASVSCHDDGSNCEVLLLHQRGSRVAGCPLPGAHKPADGSTKVFGISRKWLQRADVNGFNEGEQVASVSKDPSCLAQKSTALQEGCALVGTTHGRVAKLRLATFQKELVPFDIIQEPPKVRYLNLEENDNDDENQGMIRPFSSRYVGAFHAQRQSIHVLDTHKGGRLAGKIPLPTKDHMSSFCIGGGYIYLLGKGPSPAVFRMPVPHGLRPIGLIQCRM